MNQYYDPYAENDPNYWGPDSGDQMSAYDPNQNFNYGQDMLDYGLQYGDSYQQDYGYDPYSSSGYNPYASSGYDPYSTSGYDPYSTEGGYTDQYDPYAQDIGYDPYSDQQDYYDDFSDIGYTFHNDPSLIPGLQTQIQDWEEQVSSNPSDQTNQRYLQASRQHLQQLQNPTYQDDGYNPYGEDMGYDTYGYNQFDQNQWDPGYYNNQDPYGDYGEGDYGQTPEEAPPSTVEKFDYGNTDINNYKTPDFVPPKSTAPTQEETLAQAKSQTLPSMAAPPKPSWLEQIESGEAYKPYHSFGNNPTPYLSQEQYNTMDPSEYEGYMALIPQWQQQDFALNMQK